jgi:hypothetical protein
MLRFLLKITFAEAHLGQWISAVMVFSYRRFDTESRQVGDETRFPLLHVRHDFTMTHDQVFGIIGHFGGPAAA